MHKNYLLLRKVEDTNSFYTKLRIKFLTKIYTLSANMFCLQTACLTTFLRVTDLFSYAWRLRSSLKTPVFSNFFLKRFNALSKDSPSFILIIIIIPTIPPFREGENTKKFNTKMEIDQIGLFLKNPFKLYRKRLRCSFYPYKICVCIP